MYYEVLEKRSTKGVNLFFAGWGMDATPFKYRQSGLWDLTDRSFDTAIVYDYTNLSFQQEWTVGYEEIRLIAWSMGVWAAEQIGLPNVTTAMAVNGTGRPVDDKRGIPTTIFEGTLAALSEESLLAFHRRMCGSKAALSDFLTRRPQRSVESLKAELRAIGERANLPSPYPKQWTQAFVGENDRIFPIGHQIRYWQERAIPQVITSNHHLL